MKYEAIIFDVSDTLVEYSPNYARIFGDRMRCLGFNVSEDKAREISRAVYWASGEQKWKEQCGAPVIKDEEAVAIKDKAAYMCVAGRCRFDTEHDEALRRMQFPRQEMSIIPGVIDTLNVLKAKYRLAIVSNHYTWLIDYLHEAGLAQYFESIIISDAVGFEKPDIRIMQIALDELGTAAENCLYVGDQPLDVLCSKQIGMDCAWIESNEIELPETIPYKEDYKIQRVSDLLDLLK